MENRAQEYARIRSPATVVITVVMMLMVILALDVASLDPSADFATFARRSLMTPSSGSPFMAGWPYYNRLQHIASYKIGLKHTEKHI